MKLIDSHCHLFYDYSPKTSDDLIREAAEQGIEKLINVGTDLDSIAPLEEISNRHQNVFHTVGIHPHEASSLDAPEKSDYLEKLRKAAHHPKCRAIGELGMDRYYDHSDIPSQIKRLDEQLDLALELNLPVVIHSREAETELLASLKKYAVRVKSGTVPGVLHCFTGTREFGEACLDLGFYISFSGILTFKNAKDLQENAQHFPLDRILVETDSPYLAPIPMRGKKCEPAFVRYTAQKVAELRGLPLEELAEHTYQNTCHVFKI